MLIGCVPSGRPLNISVLQFPHLQNGDNNNACILGLNLSIYIEDTTRRALRTSLAHGKYLVLVLFTMLYSKHKSFSSKALKKNLFELQKPFCTLVTAKGTWPSEGLSRASGSVWILEFVQEKFHNASPGD